VSAAPAPAATGLATTAEVIYSLLRVSSEHLANELYLRIAEGKADFAELAATYAEGMERATRGVVGPYPLVQAHPILANVLRTSQPGELRLLQIEPWWLVVRLESLQPASFDEAMQSRMTHEAGGMPQPTSLDLGQPSTHQGFDILNPPDTILKAVAFDDQKRQTAIQRFELRLSKQLNDGLTIMAQKEGIPRSDVVRRALGLYAHTLEAEDVGQLIGFASLDETGIPQITELIRLNPKSSTSQKDQEADRQIKSFERFELRLTKPLLDGIGEMAEKERIPRADVVRRALGLYSRALEATAKGQLVAFANLNPGNAVEVVELIRIR
jgi:metal-responsive CopG/Arc/MetJ family transcriptional regulator